MANPTGVSAASTPLSGTTQETITLTGLVQTLQVINRHATIGLWFRVGLTDPGTVSAGAADTFYVLPNSVLHIRLGGWQQCVVHLLGDGAGGNPVTVQAVANRP